MSSEPGSCILQSMSYCFPFTQCVAMNAVPLSPLTFSVSPHSSAASQLASYDVWSMFGELVRYVPSSAKNMLLISSLQSSSAPLDTLFTSLCVTASIRRLRTAPLIHPCPTPRFTGNSRDRPQYVSYLSVTSVCRARITLDMLGSIPDFSSVSAMISCVHDMKNVE